jgi:hypothetical protein
MHTKFWSENLKRPLWGLIHICEDNIKMSHEDTGCNVVDWIQLAQDRDQWQAAVNILMNIRFHKRQGIS